MKRNELMVLSQYCASPQFLSLGDWVKLPNGSILAVKGTKDVTPVHCTIVGQISGEKAYVGLKGNFNPNSTYEKDARGAKIQFTLTRPPPEVVDFVDDWDVALDALAKYQDTVAGSDEHLYFIDHDNLRFNFFLFEPKVCKSLLYFTYILLIVYLLLQLQEEDPGRKWSNVRK